MAYAERRARDAACLEVLRALEACAPVERLLPLFADAGLLGYLPSAVNAHPRAELERMVATQGVAAARKIEAAFSGGGGGGGGGGGANGAEPLASDAGFGRYMALRLQLVEGSQVRTALLAALRSLPASAARRAPPPLRAPRLSLPPAPRTDPPRPHSARRRPSRARRR